ncbi:MAG: transporter substrate-binding domain-containing protein [Campylobacterota bacterium]
MRKTLLLLLLIFFECNAAISITQDKFYEKAQSAAMLSANAVYHLDQRQLPLILKSFIKKNEDIKALIITENLENKELFTYYRLDNSYNKDITSKVNEYKQVSSPIIYKDEVIGEVKVYYNETVQLSFAQKAWIAENPIIKVGLEQDWAPYDFVDENGNYSGMAYEYLELIQKYTGLKFEYKEYTYWDTLQNAFDKKEIDLLPALYKTKKRTKKANFSIPYYSMYEYVFTKKDVPLIQDIKQLYGKKVASAKGFAITHWLKKNHPQIQIVEKMSIVQCLQSVSSGETHAFIFDSSSTQYNIKKAKIENLKLNSLLEERGRKSLHMAVQKDNPMLADIINQVLKSITSKQKKQITSYWMETVSEHGIYFTENERLFLHQRPDISYVYDPNADPFDWKNRLGEHDGIIPDLLKIIKQKTSLNFKPIHFDSWSKSLNYAKESKDIMISSMAYDKQRSKQFRFTKNSIYKIPVVFVERQNETKIFKNQNKLIKNSKVAVVQDDIFENILQKRYPNKKFVSVKTTQEGFEGLLNKEFDYFVANVVTAQYYIKKKDYSHIKISQKLDFDLELKMATTKDMPKELISILDKVLQSIDEKKRDEIFHKWTQVIIKKEIDWSLIFSIISVAVLHILFFAYWNRRLHKTVASKTKQLTQLNQNLEQRVSQEVEKSKKIQEQLFRSEKMAAMGEMIANIAHQWRQPLSVISSGATGVKMLKEVDALKDEHLLKTCDMINENAQYLSQTIDDFRDFLKGERIQSHFTLDSAVEKSCHLLESAFKNYNITLVKEFQKDVWVYSNINELVQCIINIVNNANDALKETSDYENKIILIKSYTKNEFAYLEIVDSAGGIKKDITDKIFDPYFTTKHQSKGTGLGLHMTYSLVVEGLRGNINVENSKFYYQNKEYFGAKFTIELPQKTQEYSNI